MRRQALAAALSLMLVMLVGGTVSAHGGRGHHPAPSFAAASGTAEQGGKLWIGAKVGHAKRGAGFSASAVVHFASGDVTVTLVPRGNRWGHPGHHGRIQFRHRRSVALVARGWVRVGAAETPGDVLVDVTIRYGTQTVTIQTTGHVVGTEPPTDPDDGGPIQYG